MFRNTSYDPALVEDSFAECYCTVKTYKNSHVYVGVVQLENVSESRQAGDISFFCLSALLPSLPSFSFYFLSPYVHEMQEADLPAPSRCLTTTVSAVSLLELAGNQYTLIYKPSSPSSPSSSSFSSSSSVMSFSPFRLLSVQSGPSSSISTTLCLIRVGTQTHGHIVPQYQPAPVSAHCLHLPSHLNTFVTINKTTDRKLEWLPKACWAKIHL